MSKGKSKNISAALSELHFTSSMNLDEALHHISNMAGKDALVTLTQNSPDHYGFQVQRYNADKPVGGVVGTLRRWQGTQTRVDVSGRLPQHQNYALRSLLFFIITLPLIFITIIESSMVISIIFLLTISFLLLFGLLSWVYNTYNAVGSPLKSFARELSASNQVLDSRRDTEALLDDIIHIFTRHSDVELIDHAAQTQNNPHQRPLLDAEAASNVLEPVEDPADRYLSPEHQTAQRR